MRTEILDTLIGLKFNPMFTPASDKSLVSLVGVVAAAVVVFGALLLHLMRNGSSYTCSKAN